MTKITIKKYDDIKEITCTGHAGYAPLGEDIVCAGISTLIYAWHNYLCDKEKIFFLEDIFDEEKGYVKITVKDPQNLANEAFLMLITGLKNIENIYENYLKIDVVWDEMKN